MKKIAKLYIENGSLDEPEDGEGDENKVSLLSSCGQALV